MFCKNCGKELLSDEKYCSGCGKSVLSEQISYTNGKNEKKDKGLSCRLISCGVPVHASYGSGGNTI